MRTITYILFAFIYIVSACTSNTQRTKPILSNITESVYASGKVKAIGQYHAFSAVNGMVKHIAVYPGDYVKKGDIILVLDNNSASLNTESSRLAAEFSRNNYSKNSAKLREMDLNVQLALDKYQLDSSLFVRQSKLWEQNIGTKLEYDTKKQALISSATNYQAERARLKQLKLQLKNDLDKTLIAYKINSKTESDYVIKSAENGRVFDILIEKGDWITPQIPLAVLGSSSFILEMSVDENDITQIKTGLLAFITMDSYKGRVFEGVVDDNQYVWIARDKKKRVKTGLKDYQKIEITEGLDTSDFIYKPQ